MLQDIGIRSFEFVAKTQFLLQYLRILKVFNNYFSYWKIIAKKLFKKKPELGATGPVTVTPVNLIFYFCLVIVRFLNSISKSCMRLVLFLNVSVIISFSPNLPLFTENRLMRESYFLILNYIYCIYNIKSTLHVVKQGN